ncbi:MAG: histidinol-phosphate aminotransferase family protein [Myxococcales bacterium]|nr:histidinol-phosphate aminotransferase family protein [Myxococcales bacterium]
MRAQLQPVPTVAALQPYSTSPLPHPCDLRLDGNEGYDSPPEVVQGLAQADPSVVRRYPTTRALVERLADRHGVSPDQILVTAGADDALDRACRALLCPGRRLLAPVPTFAMMLHYARLSGAGVDEVPWPAGPYPVDELCARIEPATTAVAMVTPNNPTGLQATGDDLRRLSAEAPLVWLDHAYVEFGAVDLTPLAMELGNVLVFRTLSKAWGLAGLRVGYVMGPAEIVGWLSRVGLPYPVSGLSLWLAMRCLADEAPVATFVADVVRRRAVVSQQLTDAGFAVPDSGGNFVLARGPGALPLRLALAERGIAVRGWTGEPLLADAIRLTVPSNDRDQARLLAALTAILGGAA